MRRAILIDSYVHFREDGPIPHFPSTPERRYPDYESARVRFRLKPAQPETNPVLVDHVARHSIRQVPDGWTWKFDPRVYSDYEPDGEAWLARVPIPVDLVYGADSVVVDPERARRIVGALPRGRARVEIPGAHHHVMLDQPVALIAALRALLAAPPG